MRVRQKRRYEAGFREQAVELLERTDRGVTEVARSLGMPTATLSYWYGQDMASRRGKPKAPSAPIPSPTTETLQQKLARLERENASLRKENEDLKLDKEILEKAATYSTGPRNTVTSESRLKEVLHAGPQARLGRKRE